MRYSKLGNTGLEVSNISFGASSLGGVFHDINEMHAIEAVHTALQVGINYIDVAPAYGATKAETVLGKALRNIPRSSYFISTKVGKNTAPGGYGVDTFDYSYDAIMRSIDEAHLGSALIILILYIYMTLNIITGNILNGL